VVTLSTSELAVSGLGIMAPGISGPAQALSPAAAAAPGWFQAEVALPGRGYRRLPPACKYLLAAARLAITDGGGRLAEHERDLRAAVVATNNVSAALMEEMDYTIIFKGAQELPPSLSPFMIMSLFASRLSMEHDITGFNLTVNSPVTAGLEAIALAARAVAAGRASAVLVGAVEEALSPAQSADPGSQAGAAVLYCEPDTGGTAHYGRCRARSAFVDPEQAGTPALAAVLDQLLGDSAPGRIDAVLEDSAIGTAAARWLDRLSSERDIVVVPVAAHAGCLLPLQRVVGLLAQEHATQATHGVLAVSGQGPVALAELTVVPRLTAASAAVSAPAANSMEEAHVSSP
jgi:3-oxoacyl-[acyl-carrier-protein] synthase II